MWYLSLWTLQMFVCFEEPIHDGHDSSFCVYILTMITEHDHGWHS